MQRRGTAAGEEARQRGVYVAGPSLRECTSANITYSRARDKRVRVRTSETRKGVASDTPEGSADLQTDPSSSSLQDIIEHPRSVGFCVLTSLQAARPKPPSH